MDVRTAIEAADAVALRSLLAERPERANELIEWGGHHEIRTHPLHYVSDMLFAGILERGRERTLIDVLLAGGADCNHQASNGETPLIGATSLGAEDVAQQLLEAGAEPDMRGGLGETALHWAANLGLVRTAAGLLAAGADPNAVDTKYNSTPVGWAIHGCYNSPPGHVRRQHEVVAALVRAGARAEPAWLANDRVASDPRMLSALRGEQL